MNDLIDTECLNINLLYPNTILLDYLQNKEPLGSFFPGKNKVFHPVSFRGDRSIIQELLKNYNKTIDAPQETFANIEMITEEKVKFVITGQQPGFLTGPLYTIYKTLSAINYAEKYSTKELKLIPLFWNASEDHDVEEVNNIWILNKQNEIVPVELKDKEMMNKSLERLPLNKKSIKKLIEHMLYSFPETEYTKDLFDEYINDALSKSERWGEFFSRLMAKLMGKWGLILLEPKILRPHLIDFFTDITTNVQRYNKIFQKTTNELTKMGYRPKMHKKENIVGLFYIDKDHCRKNIIKTEQGDFLIGKHWHLTLEEIVDRIKAEPQNFSTNAIFRPLAQDLMIPTYIFIGGPSEIGYHIQLKDLYQEFSLQQPNLIFRMGATIIEKHINKILEKYSVKITDLSNVEQLTNRLLRSENKEFLEPYFTTITTTLENLQTKLNEINKELAGRVTGRSQMIKKTLKDIEKMYIKYIKENNKIMVNQLEKARAYLFPCNKPQERVFNIFQYLNKYSPNLLTCIKNLLAQTEPCNHVVLKCWMF
ncbi:MAG: bacillithiol biosynthesis cysteine-adding enzyme BshC [Candidatus Heimdallarchaeota archaeon]|nr:bacillithiol biosynthesis cysteine-adding enzyme BshC [Candidatus Heimdallarchaeota archaeon]